MSKAIRAVLALTALAMASPVAAQTDASRHAPATEVGPPAVPVAAAAFTFPPPVAAPFATTAAETGAPTLALQPRSSRNTALMVVGAAAMVAGAVIGGDAGTIIMVGGAGIGLYGLWRYLQ